MNHDEMINPWLLCPLQLGAAPLSRAETALLPA